MKHVGAGEQLGNYREVLTACKPEGDREIERERQRKRERERGSMGANERGLRKED